MKPQIILGIDPGPVRTAWVLIHGSGENTRVLRSDWAENEKVADDIRSSAVGGSVIQRVVCEDVRSYGLAVGETVFMTCRWIGRFWEMFEGYTEFIIADEPTIKIHLCGVAKAKDTNVRRAAFDRFEPYGGGKTPEVGTKKQPGPLFEMYQKASAINKQIKAETGRDVNSQQHFVSALAAAVFGKEI